MSGPCVFKCDSHESPILSLLGFDIGRIENETVRPVPLGTEYETNCMHYVITLHEMAVRWMDISYLSARDHCEMGIGFYRY